MNSGQFVKGHKHSENWYKVIRLQVGENNPFYGRKHTRKTKEKIRIARLNQSDPRKGKFHLEETKIKISLIKKSQKLVGEKSSAWKGGFPNCLECGKKLTNRKGKYCLRCVNLGERNYNWQGGLTPLVMQVRHCFRYRQWRSDIFTRDDFTCQFCGARSGKGKPVYLEADHYPIKFSEIFHKYKFQSLKEALNCEEMWNINNGRTLCRPCHDKTKSLTRKK